MSAPRLGSVQISLPVAGAEAVTGDLVMPAGARGIAVFAHGSGSSRLSSRNRSVAHVLQARGLATLLFDLLTESEEERDAVTAELRFDITFLAGRLRDVIAHVSARDDVGELPLGLFGASTGAAAALVAAADDARVGAIVSRGGRPDLAASALERVRAPTLLLVGSLDVPVIEMNRWAYERLGARDKQMVIVPGAGHLFEEKGKLEEVARLAADWLERWLRAA
jgi:pimeloyl-ACP methyl ester carboxylesterase